MEFLGLIAGLFGLDIFLKGRIEAQDPGKFPRDMEGTGGRIRLYRNHNAGFCFGLLKKRPDLVRQIPLIFTSAAAGVLAWLLTRKSRLIDRLGFTLVTAGALSNLFDRLKRGYVVDYFSFQVKWLEKVVFNLGDLCIFAGTALLTVSDLLGDGGRKAGKGERAGKRSMIGDRKMTGKRNISGKRETAAKPVLAGKAERV